MRVDANTDPGWAARGEWRDDLGRHESWAEARVCGGGSIAADGGRQHLLLMVPWCFERALDAPGVTAQMGAERKHGALGALRA